MDVHQLAEYRYRAVREVLGGSPIGEVAARYGTSRQTQPTWRLRFEQEGMPGLLDRSRRPRNSPTRLSAEVEADRPSAVPWVSTQGVWELFDEGALSKPWCGAWMFAVGSGLLPAQGPIEAVLQLLNERAPTGGGRSLAVQGLREEARG
ncbi:helix-turn-helix domain-containing protein [Streptomyces sp. NPDC059349]|uniref:helix-turn-helix domain-containing protein n=1 Tax=Streptomyces sp. NPDC059349 TaxID=3346808 RepID=UPI0036B2ACEB